MRLVRINQDGSPAEELAMGGHAAEVGAAHSAHYGRVGYSPPWTGYFAVADGTCVGSCSFKGPPRGDRVEIAYHTFPGHEGSGIATRMAAGLVAIAQDEDPDVLITARTRMQEGPSTAILRKLGFQRVGTVNDPDDGEVWEWHLEEGF